MPESAGRWRKRENAPVKWGSLDRLLIQDKFWQDKMGKPIANKDFMLALLTYGTLDSYRFYYLDEEDMARYPPINSIAAKTV